MIIFLMQFKHDILGYLPKIRYGMLFDIIVDNHESITQNVGTTDNLHISVIQFNVYD
jgi:hypothetical protein